MKAKAFLLLPISLILVISVSGCTVPGFPDFCIPGFGTCGQTVEYANDVIVIRSLDAVPSTVSTGQQFRLSAWIENEGSETVPEQKIKSNENIPKSDKQLKVELYDTCVGLFKSDIRVSCNGEALKSQTWCEIPSILPKQTIPITWTIVVEDDKKIPLETSCNLKIYVRYPYETDSITSITFIDYAEMQRQKEEGTYKAIGSYITEGYGPIKPYLTAEDTQPIPVETSASNPEQTPTTAIGFQVKNKGSGFLVAWSSNKPESRPEIILLKNNIKPQEVGTGSNNYKIGEMIFNGLERKIDGNNLEKVSIQLVGKESPKTVFTIKTPTMKQNVNLPKTSTYYVTTSIDYLYEFRKEVKVTIKPPKVSS